MTQFSSPLPSILLTVDVVIFTVAFGTLQVLVVRRDVEPFAGKWALPGGYLQENEQSIEAAKRILLDKAGVRNVYIEQLYTFDGIDRDPRGRHVSVVYFTLVPEAELNLAASDLTAGPKLIDVTGASDLAFDHTRMVEYARARLQSKLEYTNVVYSLLPNRFTMAALQSSYEAILGRTVDKRNFQKKYASLGLIEPTDEYTQGQKHRPARLYTFRDHVPTELKRFF